MKSVLVVVEVLIPSLYIDIINPLLVLAKRGKIQLRIKHVSEISVKKAMDTDVIVFCRSQSELCYTIFLEAKKQGVYVIYDIDDNFMDIPTSLELGAYHQNYKRLYVMLQFFKQADRVTVYSKPLYNQVSRYTQNVILQNTYFDFDLIRNSNSNSNSNSKKIKIAYASGRSPSEEVDTALEKALIKISKKYGDKIEIHYWRQLPKSLESYNNVIQNQQVPDYNTFIRKFFEQGFDIGLAPLVEDVFYMSKTNNKYREYGACNVSGIYSNVSLYNKCISNGDNGLLVDNTESDWFNAIENLIVNEELRHKIAQKAHGDILENYSFNSFVDSWVRLLDFDSRTKNSVEFQNVLDSRIIKSSCSLSKTNSSNICLLSEKLVSKFFHHEFSHVGNVIDWNKKLIYIICNDEMEFYNIVKILNENKEKLDRKFLIIDTFSLSKSLDMDVLKRTIHDNCELLIINDVFLKERFEPLISLNKASTYLGINSIGYISLEMKAAVMQSKPDLIISCKNPIIVIEYAKNYFSKVSQLLSPRKILLRIKAIMSLYQLKYKINRIDSHASNVLKK